MNRKERDAYNEGVIDALDIIKEAMPFTSRWKGIEQKIKELIKLEKVPKSLEKRKRF